MSNTDTIVTSSETRVQTFTFYEDTTNRGLTEMTYIIEHLSDTGRIYCKDSLPFGTRLDSVVPYVTYKATPALAKYCFPDTVIISTGADTLDLTKHPDSIFLYVLSSDMTQERWYHLDIYAHQSDPYLYVWEQLTNQVFKPQNCKMKVFYANEKLHLYVNNGFQTQIYQSVDGRSWALMSNGNYLNNGNTPPNLSAWEKYYLGWVEPEMLYANEHVVMPADGKTYRQLNRTGAVSADGPLTTDTTYYLENRQMTGWDAYLPGHGMLVWRVVYDANDWFYNMPNNNTTRFQLITANGSTPYTNNLNGGARQDVPFPGDWEYTEYAPYAHTQLTNIQELDGVISFDFTNTTYTDVQSPSVEMDMTEGVWYNLLGQPVDVRSYKGVVISQQGKVLLR